MKTLKTPKHKIAAKKTASRTAPAVILVGTYKERQLAFIEREGVYNYPIGADDKLKPEDATQVKELWLYAGRTKTARKVFEATFVGIQSKEEFLAAHPTYPKSKSAHTRYLVFETKKLDYGTRLDDQLVFARASDFTTGKSAKIAAAIKAYEADGDYARIADYLPVELAAVPKRQLRVCEAAVQLDFMTIMFPRVNEGQPKYRIASLFAGCGGLDLGFVGGFDFLGKHFARTGFKVCWANELNPAACKTYARNLGPDVVCGDIKDAIKTMPSDVDVVMGGFPCQDISINGKMLGINGKRSCLYTYIIEAVKKAHPKVFVAENVGSLMMKQHEHSLNTILRDFRALDYDVSYHVYHAEEYGVPQTRERVIFIGTRKDVPKFSVPKPLTTPAITAGQALRDLEVLPRNKEFSHVWSEAAPSGEQGSRKMVEDRPGYTIRAECHGNIQFHYRLPRRISMREAARIQSFPDSFLFPCGIRETERQIGNAVPPVLAWHIAKEVFKVLEETNEDQ